MSKVSQIENTLVATGFPSQKRHQNVNVHFYYQLAMVTHGVRRAGSAALDLAYVASGRLDGFWEFGLNPWDMAAGILLITEAGGKCSDMQAGRCRCTVRTCWPITGGSPGCWKCLAKYFAASTGIRCRSSNRVSRAAGCLPEWSARRSTRTPGQIRRAALR